MNSSKRLASVHGPHLPELPIAKTLIIVDLNAISKPFRFFSMKTEMKTFVHRT